MELAARLLTESDDLETVVANINSAQWNAENDIDHYEVESLRYYLQQAATLFAVCYVDQSAGPVLAGIASARVQYKPYGRMGWLYVDEVDSSANFRQRGVGTALMKLLLEYAEDNDLTEVWLATEIDNTSARKLYESLKPTCIDQVIGYTFELD